MKFLVLLLSLCLSFAACDANYQYDVYVRNNSGENLQIRYKSLKDRRGLVQDTVIVKDGEFKRIISTVDIDFGENQEGMHAKHCDSVAVYVEAVNPKNIPSQIQWCDPRIQFIKTDIQQGEFVIEYRKEDFE